MTCPHHSFRLLIAAGLAASVLAVTSQKATGQDRPRWSNRPNLVFLLSDDQRFDTMGCAGNKIIQTPNLDVLAKDGVRFRNAFVTTPICAASRASIFTGLYERTHRYTFETPPIQARHVALSYPAQLKAAGYRTGFIGKFGVGVPKGAETSMFDTFDPLNRTPYFKKQPGGGERFLEEIAGDHAVEFIRKSKPGQPFCLSLSFNAPHAEDNDPKQYFWPPEVDHLYRDVRFRPPKSMADSFFQAQPEFLKNTESRVRFHWRFDEPQKYQEMVRGYYRMITAVDRVIGRVRAELERQGVAKNTVILFMADNGYFLGERGFADKWYGYEYSLRVPMLYYDPRAARPKGAQVREQTVLNVDVAPTLLELAGVPVPPELQGRSLLPVVRDETPKDWRRDFFFEHLYNRDNIPKSEGVRTERWTYIRWFQQKPVVEELYDHEADFEEIHNLAGQRKHAKLLERLRRRTDELRDHYGGPYFPIPKMMPQSS